MSDNNKKEIPKQIPTPQNEPKPTPPRLPNDRIEKSENIIPGRNFGK
jgi:hypothetical protein